MLNKTFTVVPKHIYGYFMYIWVSKYGSQLSELHISAQTTILSCCDRLARIYELPNNQNTFDIFNLSLLKIICIFYSLRMQNKTKKQIQ